MNLFLIIVSSLVSSALGGCNVNAWGPNQCVFASKMVLSSSDQWSGGKTPARLFGTGLPNESITISGLPNGAIVLPSNPFTTTASGAFDVTVAVESSLTSYNLTFTGSKSAVTLDDVLFGHTFLCSGQSNMDMNVGCTFSVNETMVDALNYPEIRGMNQGANGFWDTFANPAGGSAFVEAFSASCYYTAYHLKISNPAFKDVPIGLVRSSVGGQCIERFESSAVLESVGVPTVNATGLSCGQNSTTLYEELIVPLAPFVFKAMIWYQGESNVNCNFVTAPAWEANYYTRLLPALIDSWRALFQVDFTALIVQLAPYGRSDGEPSQRSSDPLPFMRQSQLSALTRTRTGVAHPTDLGDDGHTIWTPPTCGFHGGIHPRNKTELGRRLALRLAEIEGILPSGAVADGPIPTGVSSDASSVSLALDPATLPGGISFQPTQDCRTAGSVPPPYNNSSPAVCCQNTTFAEYLTQTFPFELRLADNATYVLALATIETGGEALQITPLNTSLVGPFTAVRYSWQGFPLCTLTNGQGLPMAPFLLNVM